MITRLVFLAAAIVVAVVLFRLLRSGRLREKYAALWIVVGAGIVLLAVWPGLLNYISDFIGIALPVNLLFFLSILLLLGVSIHLSLEASRLEDETRSLGEEVAMLWESIRVLKGQDPDPDAPGNAQTGAHGVQDSALSPNTLARDPDQLAH